MPERPLTRRDSLDFRDRLYQPALVQLLPELWPRKRWIRLRNQGREGACTGFGLAAVIDYLNAEAGIREPVSARMLYEMARRHDQWPGESYEGSSARGTMKGWHKNGVCPEKAWRYNPRRPEHLTTERQQAALRYPLGAYYRVMPRRSDLHAALNEVHAVFASAATHEGWNKVRNGIIPFDPDSPTEGGHAFAIIGYTNRGFIIQNSWGSRWGGLRRGRTRFEGLAIWTYEDFDQNLWDAWVARTARPVESLQALSTGWLRDGARGIEAVQKAPPRHEIRDRYVHIDDGGFDPFGDYPSSEAEVEEILKQALGGTSAERPKHLVLYAHGGLNDVKSSAARVGAWQPVFEANRVRELHFIWETGFWAELRDVLLGKESFAKERAGGFGDWWDRLIEKATHRLGHGLWMEMISDAALAFEENRAGTRVLEILLEKLRGLPAGKRPQVHLVGHSAGSIWMSHLLERWGKLGGLPVRNLILFAPACTTGLYNSHLYPALRGNAVEELHHFLLDDRREQDDHVAQIYRKSLLYLVSRSYQKKGEVVPLMGMEVHRDRLNEDGLGGRIHHYTPAANPDRTRSSSHGGFDNDPITMNAMLRLILGEDPRAPFERQHLEGY